MDTVLYRVSDAGVNVTKSIVGDGVEADLVDVTKSLLEVAIEVEEDVVDVTGASVDMGDEGHGSTHFRTWPGFLSERGGICINSLVFSSRIIDSSGAILV